MESGTNMTLSGVLTFVIVLIIIYAFFGNGLGFGGRNATEYGCNRVSNCEVERQTIINTATTQNLINTQAEQTRSYLGTKVDFYAYEQLKDQLAQERTKNVVLENRVYSDAKFNDLTAQNVALSREISELSCQLPKRPPYFAQGYVPNGCEIPCGTSIA